MPTKFLNVIIIASIIGISLLSIRDLVIKKNNTDSEKKIATNEKSPPTLTPTVSPIPSVPCISTQIGDINFKTLTYQSKTTNNISLGMLESTKEATISKKPTVKSEQLVLNILDKKDDALRYSLGKDNMDLVLLCASDGVHAQILGNKLLILNSANVQKGDTWINSSTIEAPLGFEGNTSQLDFKYRVVDVIEKNAFGEKRTEVL
jgi:hypothetical protein